MANYTSNDTLFRNINKEHNNQATGTIVSAKLNQSYNSNYKLVDLVDVDWDGAEFYNCYAYTYTSKVEKQFGKYIKYDNKYKCFNGFYKVVGDIYTPYHNIPITDEESSYYVRLGKTPSSYTYVPYTNTRHTDVGYFFSAKTDVINDSSEFVEYISTTLSDTVRPTGGGGGAPAEIEVDENNNAVTVSGTKYTLKYDDGVIGLYPYTASSFASYSINTRNDSTGTNSGISYEYDTSYTSVSVTNYPYTKVSYNINHGTERILLTGIKYKNGTDTYTYIYGSEANIVDGVVSGKSQDYVNENINSSYTIPTNYLPANGVASLAAGNATSTITVGNSVAQQTAEIYYHEYGKSTISKVSTSNTSSGTWSIKNVYKQYAMLKSDDTFNAADWDSATWYGDTSTPASITFELPDKTKYMWFAVTKKINTVVFGGFDLALAEDQSWQITHYSDNTRYYVYRMPNSGTDGTFTKINYEN